MYLVGVISAIDGRQFCFVAGELAPETVPSRAYEEWRLRLVDGEERYAPAAWTCLGGVWEDVVSVTASGWRSG